MDKVILVALLLVVVGLAGVSYHQGGIDLIMDGLLSGGTTMLGVIPLLIAAFLIAGLAQVLVSRELVNRWLGEESGWKGIGLACLGGALMPGGPYAYYPITATLMKAGAGLGVLVAFVTAKNLWSLSRLPLEVALLGPRLTIVRILVTFFIPPLIGLIASKLFGSQIEKIRQSAPS